MTDRSASSPIRSRGSACRWPGHKDNHAGLMTPDQIALMREAMGVRAGHEWDMFEGTSLPEDVLRAFLAEAPFIRQGTRRLTAPVIPVPKC